MRWKPGLMLAGMMVVVLACSIPIPKIPTPAPLTLIDPVDLQKTVAADGASQATVKLGIYLGDLTLRSSDAVPFFDGHFRYNVAEWEPVLRQETVGTNLRLTVNQGLGTQLPLSDHEQYSNAWDITLGRGLPVDLQADLGLGAAQVDLGGIPLTGLSVTAGSGDVTVTCATPNPQALGMLRLTAGTGTVIATQLGNLNFDRLAFIGGTGGADLDLSGAWTRSALVDVKAGTGKVTVRTPAGVGVRLSFSGTPVSDLSTVGFTEQSENVFVNADYGNVPLTLTLNVAVAAGNITVIAP
jgi:hypothetical protein